jgi:hypothetical protein
VAQLRKGVPQLILGDIVRLSIATRYGASKCYAPTHILVTTIESSLQLLFVEITLPSKILNKLPF